MKYVHAACQETELLGGLARMTHEIRTPLNVVLGALELTLKTPLTAEQREYLTMMKTAGSSLLSVVNEILDFSRMEAGALELEQISFSPRACIDDTLQMLAGEARRKGLTLRSELRPGMPATLTGDPMRLRQILINLVSNAIKFTERGEIVVRGDVRSNGPQAVVCHFSVRDQGIGIAPERQANIFAAFRQADASTARLYGGSGLGLSIVARLVTLMQGEIWLESQPGVGSTFHFTGCFGRPAGAACQPSMTARQPAMARRSLNILLAEDDPLNRRLAQITLEQAGHRVRLAENGHAACRLRETWQPDVVVMDVRMPDMDGHAAATRMRQDEIRLGLPRVPILALTADASPAAVASGRAAGMDGHLAKPVDPAELLRLLDAGAASGAVASSGVIDHSSLLARVEGDLNLLAEIRDIFVRDSQHTLATLRHQLAASHPTAALDTLHTLRGMCRSLSAGDALKAVDHLEEAVSAADSAEIANGLHGLEHEFRRLERALHALLRHSAPPPARRAIRHPLRSMAKATLRATSRRAAADLTTHFGRRAARTSFRRVVA